MARLSYTILCLLWLAASSGADTLAFSGSVSILDGSPNFLPREPGASVSGQGTGVSSRAPSNEIHSFQSVAGFTGTATTSGFVGTGGFAAVHTLDVTGIGDASFSSAVGRLRGRLAVRGEFRKRFTSGASFSSTPLTVGGLTGLGLGGTRVLPFGTPYGADAIRFGSWTTGTVDETNVRTGPSPAAPSTGTLTGMGSDQRTPNGAGSVQFVAPMRTVGGNPDFAAIARLELHFSPEPQRAMLLLAGSCALLWLARLRRVERRPR